MSLPGAVPVLPVPQGQRVELMAGLPPVDAVRAAPQAFPPMRLRVVAEPIAAAPTSSAAARPARWPADGIVA
jgi:hypothetical protein